MIAENVVITTDHEGNNHIVPVDKLKEFSDWCDSAPDDEFEHSTTFDGQLFVVNILREL